MKVHQPPPPPPPHGLLDQLEPSTLSLALNRLHPLAPKLPHSPPPTTTITALDLRAFIDHAYPKAATSTPPAQSSSSSGGTRWNPTPEQIASLEALYRRGVRTPNARQIEQITAELMRYGRIEGKNVFYWFQNHKARERQKQKRSAAAAMALRCSSSTLSLALAAQEEERSTQCSASDDKCNNKRQCRSWSRDVGIQESEAEERRDGGTAAGSDLTVLELFPLRPERR